jgi:hypothetical protein
MWRSIARYADTYERDFDIEAVPDGSKVRIELVQAVGKDLLAPLGFRVEQGTKLIGKSRLIWWVFPEHPLRQSVVDAVEVLDGVLQVLRSEHCSASYCCASI